MKLRTSRGRLAFMFLVTIAGVVVPLVSGRAQPQPMPPSQVFFVDPNLGGGADDGSTWANAFWTNNPLDRAITAASSGDEIWCADGTYVPSGASGFHITNSIKVYGGFAGSTGGAGGGESSVQTRAGLFLTTVLDGNNSSPVLSIDTVPSPGAVIDGFKIANGVANAILTGFLSDGGGIYSHESDLLLANNLIVDNFAAHDGGGIFFEGASGSPNTLNIKLCEFRENNAEHDGGALFGQFLETTRGDIINTMFNSNFASTDGGAVYLWEMGSNHQLWFTNCVFWGNHADTSTSLGGAMCLDESAASTSAAANVKIVNCTMAANWANGSSTCTNGQALAISTHSQCFIHNSILYLNGQSGCAGTYPISGAPSSMTYSDVENNTSSSTGMLDVNPLFRNIASPSGLTLKGGPPPGPMSQCIDAANYNELPDDLLDVDDDGTATGTIQIDMNGVGRWYDWSYATNTGYPSQLDYLDMGAYEKR